LKDERAIHTVGTSAAYCDNSAVTRIRLEFDHSLCFKINGVGQVNNRYELHFFARKKDKGDDTNAR
jgi:hypothetical protein